MGIQSRATLAVLSYAVAAAAHGHVTGAVINGVYYRGFLPDSDTYQANPPTVIGWSTTATDNGFVAPDAYTSADIVCHRGAKPAGGHAAIKAGDSIAITWNTWPDSHHGPVIDMLARCPGDCETVDKTALEFFKIDGPGLISGGNPGTWASDALLKNNLTWMVQIPASLAPGNYVLRHEIIALHSAGQPNGAQNYPQCLSLAISGSGTDTPAGVKGEALYKATDPGIAFNIYTSPLDYTVPGPKLIAGASVSVAQTVSAVTATGTATAPGGGSGSGGGAATGGSSSSGGGGGTPATTTGKAGGSGSGSGGGGGSSNTGGGVSPTTTSTPTSARGTAPPNTLVTSTRRPASSLAASTLVATTQAPGGGNSGGGAAGGQTLYGQCGGSNWNGPTACAAGSCTMLNPYYYQCLNRH